MNNENYQFKGGVRMGMRANSWPYGLLEVKKDLLILSDLMFKDEYEFTKSDIEKIEIKKILPVIGRGIKICHKKEEYKEDVYFWYVSFHFDKLLNALKEHGWEVN